jgi:imidazolonepropionase-like amidohydrolase
MPQILFRNLNLLDPRWNEARGGYEVLVEGDMIKEVSPKPIKAAKAQVVDCGKRTLMPGLIDCHVHVFLVEVNIRNLENVPLTLLTARDSSSPAAPSGRPAATAIRAAAPISGHPAAAATPWSIAWRSPTAPTRCASWSASRCARAPIR